VTPYTILVDQREKAPYSFEGLRGDAAEKRRPLEVRREFAHLETGDYTIAGLESLVTVERKSLADLYSSLGQHRERFQNEHKRMSRLASACVVIESDFRAAFRLPPERSQLRPKCVYRTWLSWYHRYGIAWFFCGDRRGAEIFTFRFLQSFWRQHRKRLKGVTKNAQT
jgi:ERCC4-type nuclease